QWHTASHGEFEGSAMDWLDQEFARLRNASPSRAAPAAPIKPVRAWWQHIGGLLRTDVERAAAQAIDCEFTASGDFRYQVRNTAAGLLLQIGLDAEALNLLFTYEA